MVELINQVAKEKGYLSTTYVLGHDHTPCDYKDMRIFSIGSPTALSFGDSHPRRFLSFNFKTSELIEYPSNKGLVVLKFKNLKKIEALPRMENPYALDLEGASNAVLKELEKKKIKYRVKKKIEDIFNDEIDLNFNFLNGYRKIEKDDLIYYYNRDFLKECK